MIVYDVAVVCQVLKTTCTISIWILAFAGPKKWRFPIQYWIFLKKYPLQTTSPHPQKIWKTCSNQSNQSNQKYSTFKRTAIWTSRKGTKWSTGFFSVSFWIISFTGTSSSSITGRTWKACQVWRTTLVSVCKSTWIWFEKTWFPCKTEDKNMKGAISFKTWRTCILSKSRKYWGSYVNVIVFFGRILPGYWAFLRHVVSESFVASP